MTELFLQNAWVLRAVVSIAAIGIVISTAELLSIGARVADTGLLGWDSARVRYRWMVRGPVARVLDALFRERRYRALLCIELGAAALLAVGALHGLALAVIVLACHVVFMLRLPYGYDGADQMTLIILAGFVAAGLCGADDAAIWFIALQSCLSYAAAGFAKLVSPEWRRGTHLAGTLGIRLYGNEWVARVLRSHPRLAAALAMTIITLECAVPFAVVLGPKACIAILVLGAVFHVVNAFVMGLNTFLWAFVATYPAVLHVSLILHR